MEKKELLKALISARLDMGEIKAENSYSKGSGKIKYANINDILDYVVPILLKHGIWLEFELNAVYSNEQIMFIRLTHAETGQHKESSVKIPDQQTDQLFGASCSYRERYALIALLALPINKDDDGEAQSKSYESSRQNNSYSQTTPAKPITQTNQQKDNRPPMQGLATQKQIDTVVRILKSNKEYEQKLLRKYTLLSNMPKQLASSIIGATNAGIALPIIDGADKQVTMYEKDGEVIEGSDDFEEVNSELPF